MSSSRYQRIENHDDSLAPGVPASPPPSFHSVDPQNRQNTQGNIQSDLEDAFDVDDSSDDEADDRQRLVRTNSLPSDHSPTPSPSTSPSYLPTTHASSSLAGTSSSSTSLPGSAQRGRVYGSGQQADGVFSNLAAKPSTQDEAKDDMPPSYEEAAADQAPPYWETFVMTPGLTGIQEVFIEGLPVGNLFGFLWNALISWSLQIVGFLLTYLLHSTHAAKHGSRAGAGLTMIQMGYTMQELSDSELPDPGNGSDSDDGFLSPPDPNKHDFDPSEVAGGRAGAGAGDGFFSWDSWENANWFAYLLMILGWFVVMRAISDYLRVKRHEQLVLQSPDRGLGVPIIAEGESSERVV